MPHKGYKSTDEHKKKISKALMGHITSNETKRKISKSEIGKIVSLETRIKISKFQQGRHNSPATEFKKGHKALSGPMHSMWNPDRASLRKNLRNDPEYKQWVRAVKRRDNNICWLNDENCKGYNIVHHIKSWREYIKLRYETSNGITLCQAHHPRGRAKEKLFKKLFSYLVV